MRPCCSVLSLAVGRKRRTLKKKAAQCRKNHTAKPQKKNTPPKKKTAMKKRVASGLRNENNKRYIQTISHVAFLGFFFFAARYARFLSCMPTFALARRFDTKKRREKGKQICKFNFKQKEYRSPFALDLFLFFRWLVSHVERKKNAPM
jgi:hypothetical protein